MIQVFQLEGSSAVAAGGTTVGRRLQASGLEGAGVLGLLVLTASLAGCSTAVRKPSEPPASPPAVAAPVQQSVSAQPQPAVPGSPAPVARPTAVPSAQEIQKLVQEAEEALQEGQVERARTELQRALEADPGHRVGQVLMRQIQEPPESFYGRETASYALRANDSLSKVAQRCFSDVHMFYVIARFNRIEVPSRVAQGQVIRIPARCAAALQASAPVPPSAPAQAPATATPSAAPPVPPAPVPPPTVQSVPGQPSSATPAPASGSPATPAAPGAAPAPATRSQPSAELINRHVRAARSAMVKQDLQEALRQWNKVLELDPAHETAKYQRGRTLELIERQKKL